MSLGCQSNAPPHGLTEHGASEKSRNYRPHLLQKSALHGHGPEKAPDSATTSHPQDRAGLDVHK